MAGRLLTGMSQVRPQDLHQLRLGRLIPLQLLAVLMQLPSLRLQFHASGSALAEDLFPGASRLSFQSRSAKRTTEALR